MKSAIIALCVLGCVFASSLEKDAQVIKNVFEISPTGHQSQFETENKIAAHATGAWKKVTGNSEPVYEVSGANEYYYDGKLYRLSYIANENGYQPQADYLPTPPPTQEVPVYILRALDYIAQHPYKEEQKPVGKLLG